MENWMIILKHVSSVILSGTWNRLGQRASAYLSLCDNFHFKQSTNEKIYSLIVINIYNVIPLLLVATA